MDIKGILEKIKPEDRQAMVTACWQCETGEELKQTALANGVEMSEEEISYIMDLKKDKAEIPDDMLEAVVGGYGNEGRPFRIEYYNYMQYRIIYLD